MVNNNSIHENQSSIPTEPVLNNYSRLEAIGNFFGKLAGRVISWIKTKFGLTEKVNTVQQTVITSQATQNDSQSEHVYQLKRGTDLSRFNVSGEKGATIGKVKELIAARLNVPAHNIQILIGGNPQERDDLRWDEDLDLSVGHPPVFKVKNLPESEPRS